MHFFCTMSNMYYYYFFFFVFLLLKLTRTIKVIMDNFNSNFAVQSVVVKNILSAVKHMPNTRVVNISLPYEISKEESTKFRERFKIHVDVKWIYDAEALPSDGWHWSELEKCTNSPAHAIKSTMQLMKEFQFVEEIIHFNRHIEPDSSGNIFIHFARGEYLCTVMVVAAVENTYIIRANDRMHTLRDKKETIDLVRDILYTITTYNNDDELADLFERLARN